jgi:hypothetical protein
VSGLWRDRLIFLVGGWSMTDNVRAVQVYDPAHDRWQQATPMIGTPVFGHAGAIVGDTIAYCGGAKVNTAVVTPGSSSAVDPAPAKYLPSDACYRGDIDAANPGRIAWRRISSMPGPQRYRIAAGRIDTAARAGVMFVGGTSNPYNYNAQGYDGRPSEPEASSWIYDIVADRWMPGPLLNVATMDHRGLAQAGAGWFVVGGFGRGQQVIAHVAHITNVSK